MKRQFRRNSITKVAAAKFKTNRKKKQETQKKNPQSNKKPAETQAVPERKQDSRKKDTKRRVEGVERAAKVEGVVERMGEVGKVDGTFIPNISKRAPELLSGQLTEKQFLKCAEKYLGEGYTEVSKGRFLSKDGLRQVRYNLHEVRSFVHHAHFEVYNIAGGQVIENARVLINP